MMLLNFYNDPLTIITIKTLLFFQVIQFLSVLLLCEKRLSLL